MSNGDSASAVLAPTPAGAVQGGGSVVGGLDAATRRDYGIGEFNKVNGGGAAQTGSAGGCGSGACGGAASGGSLVQQSPLQRSPQNNKPSADESKLSKKRRKILDAARRELGKRETGGENRGVGKYSAAVLGSPLVAPWCAFFVSWAYQQAGVKLGPNGKGHGYVPTITEWAKGNGRFFSKGQRPEPGDLIVFQRGSRPDHIGIVEKVDFDGRIHTIEGNASDMVTRRSYAYNASDVLGFVKAL